MKMVLASDNAGKLREFRKIFADYDIELLSKKECGCFIEVEETGTSYEENAYLKAHAVMEATHLPALSDDSGLCVDMLDGAPGLNSARFTGSHADTDDDRIALLFRLMEGSDERRAHFACAICCCLPDGTVLRGYGECSGTVAYEKKGTAGFGYDPIFCPDGYEGATMAMLGENVKNAISHRGKAVKEFKAEWEKYIHDQQ